MSKFVIGLAVLLAYAGLLRADQIVFKNGDKLTGKITTLEGSKLKIATAVAGDVSVELKDVATFSSDAPLKITTAGGETFDQTVTAAADDQVRAATGQTIALADIKKLNPAAQKWTGSIVANGALARGNTDTEDAGITLNAVLRREDETNNDRSTIGGAYNFGRQRDPGTGDDTTTTDNWNLEGKYDRFYTPKFYSYLDAKIEHDRIAHLNYRLTPGVGLGYQWVEKPELNFRTEAGVTYIYEDYTTGGQEEQVALRLAYHLDKKLNESVSLFHNFEALPAFEDPSDYILTTDAGIHVKVHGNWFTEFKVELKRDSTPAPGADKNDVRYVLGLGLNF